MGPSQGDHTQLKLFSFCIRVYKSHSDNERRESSIYSLDITLFMLYILRSRYDMYLRESGKCE